MKGVKNANPEVLQALAREGIQLSEEDLVLTARSQPYESASANGEVASLPAVRRQQAGPEQGISTSVPLTPSDSIFLLRSFQYTEGRLTGIGRVPLDQYLHTHVVAVSTLAEAMLANEEAGAIRLDFVRTKYFFGLLPATHLWGVKTSKVVHGPYHSYHSLESEIYAVSGQRVSGIVYDWLGAHSANPWEAAKSQISDSMVRKGLLRKEVNVADKKWLCFSWHKTKTHYVLPERTATAVRQRPEGSVGQLLMECQKNRPEVYFLLMSEINKGFSRRVYNPG